MMKGRVLFALLFAALIALGISSLHDMQASSASLPPPERTAVYIAAPPAQLPHFSAPAPLAAFAPYSAFIQQSAPQPPPRCAAAAPPLEQSYYLAFYQAFHFSDRAG